MRLGGREYPLVGPDIRDPRLHVALVVVSLQVLGQTVLHFDISIAQILIAVVTCALMEFGITAWRHQVIAWPSSALLTGNGVAFVLRVPGTQHGDWWSVRGGYIRRSSLGRAHRQAHRTSRLRLLSHRPAVPTAARLRSRRHDQPSEPNQCPPCG